MNDFNGMGGIVGRLICSRQLAHRVRLPVYVAWRSPAPFCKLRKLSELTQTPYNKFSARKSSRRSWKIAFQAVSADRHLAGRINDRQARSPPAESGRMPNFHTAQRGVPPLQ